MLIKQIDGKECRPHLKGFFEDVMVAQCLRNEGIFPYDTVDDKGHERFLPFQPGHHYNYRPPAKNPEKDWYVKYTYNLQFGFDCCSEFSVSFHYVKHELMRRLFALTYGFCE